MKYPLYSIISFLLISLHFLLAPVAARENSLLVNQLSDDPSAWEPMSSTSESMIAETDSFSAYLFAYFTGNGYREEAIRFAMSHDGFNYRAVNKNQPIISSAAISINGGVRDPHILRGADGYFYMVVTDLQVAVNGWNDNQAMVFLRSDDLVNWTHSVVNIAEMFPHMASVTRCWAPQTIYDEEEGKYMVYWSMLFEDDRGTDAHYDKIYYAYADEDFTTLITEPQQLYFPPNESACIDGDIIFHDGKYHLFHKTEGSGKGIKKAVSDQLTGGYELYDRYLDQTDAAVEGSSVFRIINSDRFILMYDMYTSGSYQFTESTDLMNFSVVDEQVSMNFTPRHGTVIPITDSEARRIATRWCDIDDVVVYDVAGTGIKVNKVVIDNATQKITVPVGFLINISAFDPMLVALPGTTISPKGPVDFSKGPVNYTISLEGVGEKVYEVTVQGGTTGNNKSTTARHIEVFPNPAASQLNINVSGMQINKLEMTDVDGRVVLQQYFNGPHSLQLSLDGIQPGMYLLRINDELTRRISIKN
ncbi:T9SS type A sorting domain-containing protein [Roseimarinus sediminis]|uniref:T9SS type A sorting domain-containing protein n=1 Tax=Roseimarinus sediminis TaxID=1610899 RepID=UPI003D22441E